MITSKLNFRAGTGKNLICHSFFKSTNHPVYASQYSKLNLKEGKMTNEQSQANENISNVLARQRQLENRDKLLAEIFD